MFLYIARPEEGSTRHVFLRSLLSGSYEIPREFAAAWDHVFLLCASRSFEHPSCLVDAASLWTGTFLYPCGALVVCVFHRHTNDRYHHTMLCRHYYFVWNNCKCLLSYNYTRDIYSNRVARRQSDRKQTQHRSRGNARLPRLHLLPPFSIFYPQ